LTWSVVESVPVHEDIKRGGPRRDHLIDAYKQSLRNLAVNGIDVVYFAALSSP
jgi:mannonate dehydratase